MTLQSQLLDDTEMLAMCMLDDELQNGATPEDAVRRAVALYPQCSAAISDYAVQAAALGSGREDAPLPESDPTLTLMEKALRQRQQVPAQPIQSLLVRAQALAGSTAKLAAALSVGQSLIIKLDRRLVELASIPDAFLDLLAAHISLRRSALDEYLRMPATLSVSAEYKSRRRPAPKDRQSFSEALQTCVAAGEIAPEAAERWTGINRT